ncbi:methyltransferase, FxLD system [Amycolatopsis sp. NBC_01480]|uniref:methyltransferase, FxLD system n=1 Tax=Amycolatopsis sp. NBC_01480 TaxID=2903562 RepID=UPI002E2A825E|nr:methyltransferase, FxLD system [Amycolatopsis sp. NBC_01480]
MNDREPATLWRQVNLWCDSWQAAERMGVHHLAPLLTEAEGNGDLTAWWYIRKRDIWRLRIQPTETRDAATVLTQFTTTLTERAAIRRAESAIYEAETRRFGGPAAMQAAHRLFHTDSRHILAHLARGGDDHRSEIGVRLATRMMLAAGQDFYEQGDVWAQVAEQRADDGSAPSPATLAAVQTLITAQADTDDSPLTQAPGWATAFEDAGRTLAELAQHGQLARGLRAVLADQLLFAFNRLGIPAAHQKTLATAASRVIFHREPTPERTPRGNETAPVDSPTVRTVTMNTVDTAALELQEQELREALVAKIDHLGIFRTTAVKDVFRQLRRSLFLPGVDLATAYGYKAVVTKRADDGTALSSASSPGIVATQLEQLDARPGNRVLEIGAATGLNAGYLELLARPTGSVVTIEFDDDLADGARTNLAAAGFNRVTVLCRDGALGDPDNAPFDRIIVTAGAWDIPAAWWHQLAPAGRLVVPIRLHGSGLTRSIALVRTAENRMVSTDAEVCGFVPMRGATEEEEIHVRLTDDVILKIDPADHADHTALANALNHPAHHHWTGLHVRHDEPAAHLDLWLATIQKDLNFGKLAVGAAARDLGLADPALRWAGATLYNGGTIAYLTTCPIDDDTNELGITAHGPDAGKVSTQLNDLLHHWDQHRPAQPTITAYPSSTSDDQLQAGAHITRPNTWLTIAW